MEIFNANFQVNESIYFDYTPVPTFAGHLNRYPFKVVITSSNSNPHIVSLDSKYSKSYKSQKNKNKWSFLRPEVRFLDLSGNEVNHVITKDTKIYKNPQGVLNTVSGNFIGVSGYAEFYFVDDIYNYDLAIDNKKYSTIVAVLETSGINYFDNQISRHILSTDYSNSKAVAYKPHVFVYRDPDYIKISENGIRDFINPRWSPVNQYTVFTFNWNNTYFEDLNDGIGIVPFNIDSNFNKSLPSNTNTNTINITSAGNNIKIYYHDPTNLYYQDIDGYLTPGYCKTFFNIATSTKTLKLSAKSTFYSPETLGLYYSPKLWLSNPNAGLMSLVEYNFSNTAFAELSSFFLLKANIYNFKVPIVNKTTVKDYDIFDPDGYHSIDSIAVLPSPDYKAWAIDSDLNYLYKFNTQGKILSAINLLTLYSSYSSILPIPIVEDKLSPNSIVLDSQKNIWISLYDNKYVLNLDSNGKFVYVLDLTSHLAEIIPPNINTDWYKANQPNPDDDINAQNFVEPTFIDIDSKDDIWVTYSNYASGYLTKFNRNNYVLSNITYPVCSCPQDLIVDNEDNVWVALSNNIWRSLGQIEKRDTEGNLLSSYGPIMGVNELALDLNQNLWFTYSYSRIGCIDNITGNIVTFDVSENTNVSPYVPYKVSNPNINTDETALEGIACDLKGFLYVVNSVENQVYVYDTKNKKYVDKFYVNPQGFVFWKRNKDDDTQILYNQWNKSLQAHGDWIGTKWINKYRNLKGTYQKTISGESVFLNFVDIPSKDLRDRFSFLASTFYQYIETDKLQKIKVTPRRETVKNITSFNLDFYKINEDYDLASHIKSYAIMPSLYESSYLFDKFFPSIYGTYPYDHYDLGIYSYEKIANYVLNHSDIDTCNLESLYDLAEAVDDKTDDYMMNYPLEIKRLMDILSINPCKIFGSIEKNQNYFKESDKNGNYNRGKLLSLNYNVTAGVPVILKAKSLDKYQLIQTGPIYVPDEQFQIDKSLDNFINIILDKNDVPKTKPEGLTNETNLFASESILKYKSELQKQIVDYAKYFYPDTLVTNSLSAKCYRDTGYIIDAIAADIANNTNHRSVDVADVYFKGAILNQTSNYNSTIPTIPQDQVEATVSCIRALQFYINGINIPDNPPSFTEFGILSSIEAGAARIPDVYSRIDDIIYTLENNGNKRAYDPLGNPSNMAKDIGYKISTPVNKAKIQKQVANYVLQKKYLKIGAQPDPILSDKCKRDIGLMVDAVVNDLTKGATSKSIQYALGYWNGSTSRLPEDKIPKQRLKTIDTINTLKNYIINTFVPPTSSYYKQVDKITDSLDNFNRIILNLNDTPQTKPYGQILDQSYQIASQNILKYKSDLQLQTVKYIKRKYPQSLNTSTLSAKSYRDVGYIIDAIAADLANNTNHRSIDVGDVFFKAPIIERSFNIDSNVPMLPQNQVEICIDAINALKYYINGNNIPSIAPSFTYVGILSSTATGSQRQSDVISRIDNVLYPFQNNGMLNDYYPKFLVNQSDVNLGTTLSNNRSQIQNYMADYVASKGYLIIDDTNPPSILVDKCNRDVGLMIDAVANDLITGVNSKSIQYGLSYWDGSTSRLPENKIPEQKSKTIDTINFLKKCLIKLAFDNDTFTTSFDVLSGNLYIYPLQNLAEFLGLEYETDNNWQSYYEFYEFIPTVNMQYSDNIIDWDNPQTTLINDITNIFEWVGDQQYIDSLFSYKLYKGLGIF
jgi:hypothetical protein